jgi:CheY-like chemotaxis protein
VSDVVPVAARRRRFGTPVGYEGQRRKVLVVDDAPQNRAMLVDSLGMLGFEVFEAGNGQQALDFLQRIEPDLVLMDVMMPVLDGLEATQCIRSIQRFAALPIIAASASATSEVEAAAREAGADAFIAKPIDQEALLQTVGRLLDFRWIYEDEGESSVESCIDLDPSKVPNLPLELAETLHRLALIGNMRFVLAYANELQSLDPRFAPLAQQLRILSAAYQSKAILRLAEQCRRAASDPATV